MSDQDEEEARHLLHQQYERPEQQSYVSDQDDITAAVAGMASEEQWNCATRSPETVETRRKAAKQFDN